MSSAEENSQAAAQDNAPPPAPAETAPAATEPETSVESADATAPESETAAASEEFDPYADLEDDIDTQPATLDQVLKTPVGKRMYQGYKFTKELSKPTTDGGIGHLPSVQDVKTYFAAHRGQTAMWQDYTSGDPARIGKFLGHWFGPDQQTGQMRPASVAALEHLEPMLASNPEAYGLIASPVMSRYGTTLIDKWQSATEPKLKDALYQAAQIVHHDLTGEWLPETAFKANGQSTQNGQPVVNPDRQALDAEWQRLNAAKQQAVRETQGQWNAKLEHSEKATISSELDKALKPILEMKIKTPELYESLKDRMSAQVNAALRVDPEVWGLYQAKVEAARRTGNPAAIEKVIESFVALAIPVIRAKRGPFLKGAGVVIKQQSNDKHAQLRDIASHAAPSNTGVAVKRSVVPASAPKPGESREEYRERRLVEAMNPA